MRRAGLITAALLVSLAAARAEEAQKPAPRFSVTAEYRQDTIDYDDVEKRFFRETAGISFGKSSANVTHLHVQASKENRFTYAVYISGLTPYFDCVVGHYYLNFGAGLIVGKKRMISPDLFSRRMIVSAGEPFSPCTSGNPLFAFRGICGGFTYPGENVTVSLFGFFSFRDRYVRTERESADRTGTSLSSILIRSKKDYRYSEPAEVFDYGGILIIRILSHVTLEWYGIYTGARRCNNRRLIWDYGDRAASEGIRTFYGYGFCIRYRDDYITLFAEAGLPYSEVVPAGGRRTRRGIGTLCGLAFRYRAFAFSCSGKITDKSFYAPHSAGRNYAERAFTADISVLPIKTIALGGSFLIEKKAAVSGYERFLACTRRERVFFKINIPQTFLFTVKLSHIENEKKYGNERSIRINASGKIILCKSIDIKFGGALQPKGGALSGSAYAGLAFCMFHCMTIHLQYSRFFITGDNSLYAVMSPQSGSISRGSFIDVDSDIFTCRVTAKYHDSSLSIRYRHQLAGFHTKKWCIEISATGSL